MVRQSVCTFCDVTIVRTLTIVRQRLNTCITCLLDVEGLPLDVEVVDRLERLSTWPL